MRHACLPTRHTPETHSKGEALQEVCSKQHYRKFAPNSTTGTRYKQQTKQQRVEPERSQGCPFLVSSCSIRRTESQRLFTPDRSFSSLDRRVGAIHRAMLALTRLRS